ncbi:hypothetical protein B296_00045316 [Ensete ventricosum]|uniref:Uncharacterized protein n=1 Tax=Ensete ventricosum TaxID=4639 RepID=A0A426YUV1_ENSVE|nr:hypothetical protein B296_00045316 [Ensete ventricosum]
MRTAAGFPETAGATEAAAPSPWQSPVPYLFGGLAAMLGLIALALLILACSYWKLSSYLDPGNDDDATNSDHEKPADATAGKDPTFLDDWFLVIMAGDHAPTFLAVPIAGRLADRTTTVADGNLDEEDKQPERAVTPPPQSQSQEQ